jgi:uncharacterized protein (TIGR02757 family)
VGKQPVKIKDVLERLYAKYNRRYLIKPDPLQFVYRYSSGADMEIAGLLAAVLAYGRVEQIEKSLDDLLERMGNNPFEFALKFDEGNRRKIEDFKHRFTTGGDISELLTLLKKVLNEYGSIENFFVEGYTSSDKNIIPALSKFCDSLLEICAGANKGWVPKGVGYLLPRPAAGSVCKRLNLFLRWMVRKDDVDTGLWKSVDKAKLVVPVDVHIGRLCKILGFYDQKTISLSAAIKITEGFAAVEPADPVKYDFALSRIGIVENCTGKISSRCRVCELFEYCSNREDWA